MQVRNQYLKGDNLLVLSRDGEDFSTAYVTQGRIRCKNKW
jgi:hypothetical protein